MHNSKTKWLTSLVAIALMLASVSTVNAQSNITTTLSVGRAEITVGDVIPLTLHVTHPAGWRVIIPTLDKQWGEFEVRHQSTPTIVSNGDSPETTSQTIEVARLRPGEVQTPAFTISVADDQGNLHNVEVAPVSLVVQSVLVAGDTTLHDIKPQADLITSQHTFAPIMVVLALGLLMLIVYGVKRWRNRPVVDKRTPRERALDTLTASGAQDPQTPEDFKAMCVDIARCLRGYIASVTTIPAHDLTTNELARQLKINDVPADWSAQVIELLRMCDSVKFAGDILDVAMVHGLVDMVEILVQQYPPVPDEPASARSKRTHWKGVTA